MFVLFASRTFFSIFPPPKIPSPSTAFSSHSLLLSTSSGFHSTLHASVSNQSFAYSVQPQTSSYTSSTYYGRPYYMYSCSLSIPLQGQPSLAISSSYFIKQKLVLFLPWFSVVLLETIFHSSDGLTVCHIVF